MKVTLAFLALVAVSAALYPSFRKGSPRQPSPLVNLPPGVAAVQQHYGYINVNAEYNANLFYWMFESQSKPSTDPVVLWMTGGPGCSSELATFFENGPYTVQSNLSLSTNPFSWNTFANLLYIDQPAGTGFSYADQDYVTDEKQVGEEMYAFLTGFFQKYPQFLKNEFYIVGESYGGHYVPATAYKLVKMIKAKATKINFKGVGIGNGWVDPYHQYPGYGKFAYENGLIDKNGWAQMNQTVQQCQQELRNQDWDDASWTCGSLLQTVAGNLNVYNIKLQCNPPPLCYDFSAITNYLNQDSVLKKLGVDKCNCNWQACSNTVNGMFGVDRLENFAYELPLIMNEGIRVTVYNGDLDLICNWVGGSMWVNAMKWDGQSKFQAAPTKPWKMNGNAVGTFKNYDLLTFVRVYQAGHMVPHDQPAAALDILKKIVGRSQF
jgi:serine carboxypeptidase-like clade 4